jgi:hypothetical protein
MPKGNTCPMNKCVCDWPDGTVLSCCITVSIKVSYLYKNSALCVYSDFKIFLDCQRLILNSVIHFKEWVFLLTFPRNLQTNWNIKNYRFQEAIFLCSHRVSKADRCVKTLQNYPCLYYQPLKSTIPNCYFINILVSRILMVWPCVYSERNKV